MKSISIYISALTLIVCSLGCSEKISLASENEDYFFHVKEEGAYLPVWVRGNVSSKKILLYVQGGPGLNTIDFATVDYMGWEGTLEKDYAIAYYDQRGMGNAQGDFDWESISLDQYMKDLRKIVFAIKTQYPETDVYLFGHSFGGWLSYLYEVTYADEPVVDGVIAMNAPFSTDKNEIRWTFRHAFLKRVAEDFIEKEIEMEYWTEVFNWTNEHPVIDELEERRQWNRYVINGLSAYEIEPKLGLGKILKGVFASSINIFPTLLDVEKQDKVADLLFADQDGIELLDRLAEMQSPLLMITGSYDDIAPAEELEFAFEQIGSIKKQLVVLPDAGHDSMLNQPEQFRKAIKDFVN
ncbi:MAG: alpha/beta hydrolase [Bacteroidota bacterium]